MSAPRKYSMIVVAGTLAAIGFVAQAAQA